MFHDSFKKALLTGPIEDMWARPETPDGYGCGPVKRARLESRDGSIYLANDLMWETVHGADRITFYDTKGNKMLSFRRHDVIRGDGIGIAGGLFVEFKGA